VNVRPITTYILRWQEMTRFILLTLFTLMAQQVTLAASVTATGPGALALAAMVAQHSPLVRPYEKRVIARLFRGDTNFGYTPGRTITVGADSVVCKTGNIDITQRSCELTFAMGKRDLAGREANEIAATASVAGAQSEGAAGSTVENLSKLACTVDPDEIMKKAGGGVECKFDTGQ
jgi:hypothetical protein